QLRGLTDFKAGHDQLGEEGRCRILSINHMVAIDRGQVSHGFRMTQPDPSSALGYWEFLPHTPEKFRQPWDYTILQDHNYLPIQSVLFTRDCFVSRGGMDETLDQLEDWELWLRYGADNHFVFVPKTTSLFRTPADQNERYRRQLLLHQNYHRVKAKFTCQLAAAGAK
ncbi:hypothetical protein K1I42_10595, partial [Hydrogenophilus thermoluteolus]